MSVFFVILCVLVSSAVNHGFEPERVKPRTNKIGICCFSVHCASLRSKTVWLGFRIMCPSEATYLPMDCCSSELAL